MEFKYKIIKNTFSAKLCKILIKKTDFLLKKQKNQIKNYKNSHKFYGELMNPFIYDPSFYKLLSNNTILKELKKILGSNDYVNMFAILKKKPGETLRKILGYNFRPPKNLKEFFEKESYYLE